MNKFDQTILEFAGNLPSVNSSDVVKKLAPALKSLPTNVSQSIAGIGGAIDDATQKNPEEAMLIDKLKDPTSKFSADDLVKLQKLMTDRGIEFKQQQQSQETPEQEETETSESEPKKETPSTGSSTSYGGQLQGI